MTFWYSSDETVDTIPVDDRAALYGDGLFETIAVRNGRGRLWNLHFERLQVGCTRLGIAAPAETELKRQFGAALDASGIDLAMATAKIVVSSGCGPRGYRRQRGSTPVLRIGVFPAEPLAASAYCDGVAVRRCQTRLGIQPQLAGMKTLNRLEQVLARAEWDDRDTFEGLMHDTDGRVICGTMSNVFIVSGNTLHTPAMTRCGVSGVMRRHVLALLAESGNVAEVRDIDASELDSADEVFLTNSQVGIVPVRALDGLRWAVGTVTATVMTLLAANGVPECQP